MSIIEAVKAALEAVPDPAGKGDLITSGRAPPPKIDGGRVTLVLDVTGLAPAQRDALDLAVHKALEAVEGVTDIRVAMTAERPVVRSSP
jgi:ATP-binding protein involved in chromosome partitioning